MIKIYKTRKDDFKVGSIVICVDNTGCNILKNNREYTVEEVSFGFLRLNHSKFYFLQERFILK